jgi:hypothetical protein
MAQTGNICMKITNLALLAVLAAPLPACATQPGHINLNTPAYADGSVTAPKAKPNKAPATAPEPVKPEPQVIYRDREVPAKCPVIEPAKPVVAVPEVKRFDWWSVGSYAAIFAFAALILGGAFYRGYRGFQAARSGNAS